MRIAVPVAAGRLAMHFGHCEQFAFVDVDEGEKQVLNQELAPAPPHEPGVLPAWLASHGVQVIIAGGMGNRARSLFADKQIEVVIGAPAAEPDDLVKAYLEGTLVVGENICDH